MESTIVVRGMTGGSEGGSRLLLLSARRDSISSLADRVSDKEHGNLKGRDRISHKDSNTLASVALSLVLPITHSYRIRRHTAHAPGKNHERSSRRTRVRMRVLAHRVSPSRYDRSSSSSFEYAPNCNCAHREEK